MRFQSGAHANNYVTKMELGAEQKSEPVRWVAPRLQGTDRVLRGNVGFLTVQDGLSVHYSNAEDLHDLKIETECGPRLSVSVFLEGAVNASVGAMTIPMPRYDEGDSHWQPVATIFAQARTERFVRRACRGMRLKKVTVSIAPEWLEKPHLPRTADLQAIKDFARCHLASRSWLPSAHAIALAEQIISTPNSPSFVQALYVESRVVGLLEEAFRQVTNDGDDNKPAVSRPQDRRRLKAIERYLNIESGGAVSVEQLGRAVGLSANSLQRLISGTFGISASRYIRQFRLEKAREALESDGVSIAEAAYIAGYNSPANFATAFKRCFGLSPSSVKDRH